MSNKFWSPVTTHHIHPKMQTGVHVSVEKIVGSEVVAAIRTETKNTENYALFDLEELATLCSALASILADNTPSLQNVDPRPHLEELDEIDAQL